MLARWLRVCLAVELAAIAIGLAWAVRTGLIGSGWAWIAAPILVAVPHAVAVGAAFAVARRHASPVPPGVQAGWRGAWAGGVGEWLVTTLLFVAVQPFPRAWTSGERVDRPPAGRRPVLLVHGYMCNRGLWCWFARRLRADGFVVATVDLEPPLACIDRLVDGLAARIERLVADADVGQIDVVAHSMGGLVARAYLRRYGPDRIARLVTLGTPHHGTALARLGPGRNAREMEPDSPWLHELTAAGRPPIRSACVWSTLDEVVAPQDSGRFGGAREHVLSGLGHLALAFSPAVHAIVVAELTAAD